MTAIDGTILSGACNRAHIMRHPRPINILEKRLSTFWKNDYQNAEVLESTT
jgi:hypothetical protein